MKRRGEAAARNDLNSSTWKSIVIQRRAVFSQAFPGPCGDEDAEAWLRARVDDNEILDLLARRRGRGVEPARLRHWQRVVGISRDQVDEWIAAGAENPWRLRTGGSEVSDTSGGDAS